MKNTKQSETATIGGGCFWCMEAIFNELRGVNKVVSGYSGGIVPDPSYRQVCTGTTGHAEVIRIEFDPKIISFSELLEVFFMVHDPTTLDRQGTDVGTQYRSVIFYHTPEQKEIAEEEIARLEEANIPGAPILTEVTPFEAFYPAEEYHQKYFERENDQPYCRIVIAPKLAKFHRQYQARMS